MPPKTIANPTKVGIIGTYIPRRCGIATFTADLLNAVSTQAPETDLWAVAVNDVPEGYDYPPEVQFEIGQKVLGDYRTAVDFLNMNEIEAVSLQHEFGIFGGKQGSHILRVLQNLRMPVVTTLHTVLQEPDADQKQVIATIGELSDRVVVMSKRAKRILAKVYGVPESRIAVIPHGVPDVPFLDSSYHKDQFGLVGKKVILSFGLISRGKGLEFVIEAMPKIVAAHPDTVFVVVGETHPGVKRHEGESYRESLKERARELGVADNVVFYDEFVDTVRLTEFLSIADICVTPYLNREQIVSGVLSYALGAGKAIVSTPYWYAEEMLAEGRGRLVPFRDADAIAREVVDLLSNDVERQAMRKQAYTFARDMVWSEVGGQYMKLFRSIRRERTVRPRIHQARILSTSQIELPQPRLDHLRVLTDDTGIFQHARFAVPDRNHGYCTDDNARALIVALMGQHVLREPDALIPFAYRYLSFLQHAFNDENGRFRNFMSFDRRWQESVGSEDSHGRALWGLGHTVLDSPSRGMVGAAMILFEQALPAVRDFISPRAWSFALVGIDSYLRRLAGASEARRARTALAEKLFAMWKANATPDWPWLESYATYANGIIPQAMILSGTQLERPDMVEAGLKSLRWLMDVQTDAKGHFVPIGNAGWLTRDGVHARFDQQPIEAQHMVDAMLDAHQLTGDAQWMEDVRRCFEWFLGRNDLQQPISDQPTGGCRDGLSADGVNQNQGAESTLAWLHSLMRLHMAAAATVTTARAAADDFPPPGPRTRGRACSRHDPLTMAEETHYRGLFERYPNNPIIRARDIPYRCNTVFNAAAAIVDGETLLLLRVEDMRGHSHLTVARSTDGITNWRIDAEPTFVGDPDRYPEEIWGIEDPRITYLEEQKRWAIAYTAFSVGGPLVSLATTTDFKTFSRLGPVMPPEDKDAALFPVRFNGRWAMLHRPVPAAGTTGAHIWLSWSPDLKHWGDHHILLRARRGGWWDANKIGLSPPPLRTDEGWLILYHGVRNTASGAIYRLGLALLDLENPAKVIYRSDEWVFEPEADYERFGDVDKVVFPCGWINVDGAVRIYYGAADSRIALATAKIADLLDWLRQTAGRMRRDDI